MTIGAGMIIKGRIESQQDVRVDGEIEGTLEAPSCRVVIGPHGKVDAHTKAREMDVQGSFDGAVDSTEKVSVRKGGRLVGDVRTGGIVIEDGAYFQGSIDFIHGDAQPVSVKTRV